MLHMLMFLSAPNKSSCKMLVENEDLNLKAERTSLHHNIFLFYLSIPLVLLY